MIIRGILILTIISLLLPVKAISGNEKQEIDSIVNQLGKKYRVNLYYEDIPDTIHSNKISYKTAIENEYEKLLKYLVFFSMEFNKYPKKFTDKINLKRIMLVKELALSGQYRTAIPDSTGNAIFYDFDVLKYGLIYSKHITHHELFHFIEKQIFGTYHYKDSLWIKLNTAEFTYGKGGKYCYDENANFNELLNPYKGFINLYAMSGLEEDRAEIYASLFVEQERFLVNEWMAKHDKIVAKKVKYMKHFLHSLCKEINNRYWRKLK